MELQTTLSRSSNLGEYSALISTMTSGVEYDLQERTLQFIHAPAHITSPYWITANALANSTVGSRFIVLRRIDNYEEYRLCEGDTSGLGMSFASLFSHSSGEATETHIHTRHNFSGLLYRPPRSLEIQLIFELFAPPDSNRISAQVIQEQDEQETIRADTNRSLSFGELLYALDRISHPIEAESIPLSVDPDDYPVV